MVGEGVAGEGVAGWGVVGEGVPSDAPIGVGGVGPLVGAKGYAQSPCQPLLLTWQPAMQRSGQRRLGQRLELWRSRDADWSGGG